MAKETRMTGAELPAGLIEPCIRDMAIGAAAWTVPWAMMVDSDHRCYLNGRYSVKTDPGGTVQMRIERTTAGYSVETPRDYTYSPVSSVPWNGATDDDLIPVWKLTVADWSFRR
jgi:hypothetical protein